MAEAEAVTGAKEKWLVRTERNVISGPMSREEVQKLIQDGQLGIQDEVCKANSYWVYLHETDEIKKQLDILVQRVKFDERDEADEETETEILSVGALSSVEEPHQKAAEESTAAEAVEEPTSEIAAIEEEPQQSEEAEDFTEYVEAQGSGGDAEIPELGETVSEETSVLSNRAFRQVRTRKDGMVAQSRATDSVPEFFQASVKVGQEEHSKFWRGFAVFLVIFVIALLVAMIWVLKSPSSR